MPDNEVAISLKDVYIEVLRLKDAVAVMTPQAQQLADHESRIRSTERWKYSLPVSVLLAIGSTGMAIADIATRH